MNEVRSHCRNCVTDSVVVRYLNQPTADCEKWDRRANLVQVDKVARLLANKVHAEAL